jgi:hypothetical protein
MNSCAQRDRRLWDRSKTSVDVVAYESHLPRSPAPPRRRQPTQPRTVTSKSVFNGSGDFERVSRSVTTSPTRRCSVFSGPFVQTRTAGSLVRLGTGLGDRFEGRNLAGPRRSRQQKSHLPAFCEALLRTRTADPLLTMEIPGPRWGCLALFRVARDGSTGGTNCWWGPRDATRFYGECPHLGHIRTVATP